MTDAPPACSEPWCGATATMRWRGRAYGNQPFTTVDWRYSCSNPDHMASIRRQGSITRYEGLAPGETARTVQE